MRTGDAELIWQRRIQPGDEPGLNADAEYAGLTVDLPITLTKQADAATVTATLVAEGVRTIAPYEDHLIEVIRYNAGVGTVTGSGHLASMSNSRQPVAVDISLELDATGSTVFVARAEIDTAVQPGLFYDFVLMPLRQRSLDASHVGAPGFRT